MYSICNTCKCIFNICNCTVYVIHVNVYLIYVIAYSLYVNKKGKLTKEISPVYIRKQFIDGIKTWEDFGDVNAHKCAILSAKKNRHTYVYIQGQHLPQEN